MSKATLNEAKHTLDLLSKFELSSDDMYVLHSGFLSDLLQSIKGSRYAYKPSRDDVRIALGLLPKEPKLTVDYGVPFEKMVKLGKYETVFTGRYTGEFLKEWLKENPKSKKGIRTLIPKIITLPYSVNLDENEAEKFFKNQPDNSRFSRLASYEELFAFGAAYPKMQERYGVIFGKAYPGPKSFRAQTFHPNLCSVEEIGDVVSRGLSFESGGVHSNKNTTFLFVEG